MPLTAALKAVHKVPRRVAIRRLYRGEKSAIIAAPILVAIVGDAAIGHEPILIHGPAVARFEMGARGRG